MLVFLTLVLKLSKRINVLVEMLEMKLYIPTEVTETSFARDGEVIHIDDNTVANLMFKYGRIVMCCCFPLNLGVHSMLALKRGQNSVWKGCWGANQRLTPFHYKLIEM